MTHPTPPWTVLREHAPEILDDFVDLWARLTHTPDTSARESRELRWLVEHLATLIEDRLADQDHDCGCCYGDGDSYDEPGDDDELGLVTL